MPIQTQKIRTRNGIDSVWAVVIVRKLKLKQHKFRDSDFADLKSIDATDPLNRWRIWWVDLNIPAPGPNKRVSVRYFCFNNRKLVAIATLRPQ